MKKSTEIVRLAAAATALGVVLTGCSAPNDDSSEHSAPNASSSSAESSPTDGAEHGAATESSEHESGGHAAHSPDGGAPPEGIEEAADPKFAIGDTVVLTADHMPGMKGAEATVSGAFDTTTYSISYTPSDGGEPVKDHKWVVHEELEDPGEPALAEGDQVIVEADHMPGMKGAGATIDSVTDETVYMVDLTMDGMEMTNHKWVVESEMMPQK